MQHTSNISQKISLGFFSIATIALILGLLPLTDNFIIESKTLLLFGFAGIVGLLFAFNSMRKQAISFLWSPLSLPVMIFGGSMLASSLLTNSYPQESLLGMGGVFIAGSIITLLGSVLLPKNAGSVFLKSLAIAGVLLTTSTALQLLGFGPSKLLEPLLGFTLPHTVLFNLTDSSFVALQVLVIASIGLIAGIFTKKHISKFSAITLPILIIGIALHGWSMLPGKPSELALPSFKAGWSVALDVIREPRAALIGVGPASYENAYLKFKPLWVNATPNWNTRYSQAANAPLHMLTIGGFIGLGSWLFLLARMFTANKQSHKDSKAVIITAIACGVFQLFLPGNVLIISLQFILLAVFLASEADRHLLFNLTAPSLAITSENGKAAQTSKAVAPIYIVAILIAVGFSTLLYLVGKNYAAQIALHQGSLAAQADNGIAVYNNHQRAITLNPYLDSLHREYALTNMLIAAALSNKTDATEEEKTQVGQLMQQAVREARDATALDPNDSQNWVILAQIYQNMIGLSDEASEFAIQSYITAIENDPTNPGLRISLGGLFLNEEKFEQAASLFQQATELKPDFPNAHYNLAVALIQLKQLEAARASYQQVLALLDPASEDYTTVNQELEQLEEALAQQAEQEETQNPSDLSEGQQDPNAPSITDQTVSRAGQSLSQPTGDDVQFPPSPELSPAQ